MLRNERKLLGLLSVLALALTACAAAAPTPTATAAPSATEVPTVAEMPTEEAADAEQEMLVIDESGITSIDLGALDVSIKGQGTGQLSDEEIEGLLYIREEEKLAHDVYLTLYQTWNHQTFRNISNSEQTHTEAVLLLIERYGLDDPAAGKDIGEFSNQELQALYDQLIEQGSRSLPDALRVGAAIEEIDILDLEERIDQTDNRDIRQVYENLMMGSRNHLRAFVSVLEGSTGETYRPQYLSQEEYDAIISGDIERGRGQGQGWGHGQGQGGGYNAQPWPFTSAQTRQGIGRGRGGYGVGVGIRRQ